MQQIPLEFAFISSKGREDFLVSDANSTAVSWLDKWPNWPAPFLLITGPKGCGKTHLSHIWADKTAAKTLQANDLDRLTIEELAEVAKSCVVLEDVDEATNEPNFFHLYNLIKENGQFLLITSQLIIDEWDIQLPDLRSRMATVQVARIEEPDDMLFGAILLKLFSDRQLQVTPEVIQYLLTRLERTFKAALSTVEELDSLSLSEKRRITIPLVRDLLNGMNS
ncbi:HdaA/DnaA family protein [Sneathiella limimaris]|uniref:HdaA/DnaA family protein n=1 Tax=Sneathiella limimaris TaxID=1964213 RepID=UPI00146AE018|nr:DnaA/Hda family protein [Sneathiella limimaris]